MIDVSLAFAPECCHPVEEGWGNDVASDKGVPRSCVSNDDAYALSTKKAILGVAVYDEARLGGSRQVPSERRYALEQQVEECGCTCELGCPCRVRRRRRRNTRTCDERLERCATHFTPCRVEEKPEFPNEDLCSVRGEPEARCTMKCGTYALNATRSGPEFDVGIGGGCL